MPRSRKTYVILYPYLIHTYYINIHLLLLLLLLLYINIYIYIRLLLYVHVLLSIYNYYLLLTIIIYIYSLIIIYYISPIRLSGRGRSCLAQAKPGMFGLGMAPKENFLAYSTQFLFLIIRPVPGNVIMVAIYICGKSPITGEWIVNNVIFILKLFLFWSLLF